jgi:5-methylcytosine-specific restriction protein A
MLAGGEVTNVIMNQDPPTETPKSMDTTLPLELKPTRKELVINLVRAAGIDVSDWANVSGGAARAAVNPKYCYEWAFAETGHVVILNLWYDSLRQNGGTTYVELNFTRTARNLDAAGSPAIQILRAQRAGTAVRDAFAHQLPVRVIINEGTRRPENERGTARVKARKLDSAEWRVDTYDVVTGAALLVRGPRSTLYVDQFSAPEFEPLPTRHVTTRHVFDRSRSIRDAALARAQGYCESCKEPGFPMPNGARYLETHHIVPLSEGGADEMWNVIAICPNHHRRAHYGVDKEDLRAAFQRIARENSGSAPN